MTARELDEAMRYGSDRDYDRTRPRSLRARPQDGLAEPVPAASRSRRGRTPARPHRDPALGSRRGRPPRRLGARAPHPARVPDPSCSSPLAGTSGTVVLWERLDRVLGYRRPDGAAAMAALEQPRPRRSREHLEMVFHRFLSGELRGRRRACASALDGDSAHRLGSVRARRAATRSDCRARRCGLTHDGRRHAVTVRPYVLPAQIQFSSPEAHAAAAGPARWNRQQGLYIYRADRLIQSGGWNRLRTTRRAQQARANRRRHPAGAEAAFGINVSKMRVTLPAEVRPELGAIASGVVARAQDAYRRRVALVESTSVDGVPERGGDGDDDGHWQLADHWPLIVRVLERELCEHPELLRRSLLALANAKITDALRPVSASV